MYHPKITLSNGIEIVFLETYSKLETIISFHLIFCEVWDWVDQMLPDLSILEFSFSFVKEK
jgi:hypothetical protein